MNDREFGADPGLGYSAPHSPRSVVRLTATEIVADTTDVAEEVPVALVYGSQTYAVVMCTPMDLEDFAIGFTVTEGIVDTVADVRVVDVTPHSRGIDVRLHVPASSRQRLDARHRSLPSRSGCGLCGIAAIDEVVRGSPSVHATWTVDVMQLRAASTEILAQQSLHRTTRATHAAAWVPADDGPAIVREDVGRHNAVDKLVGALWRAGIHPANGFAVLTSRVSYELVQKLAAAGIPIIAAASRPTGLALRLAERAGITVAHVRADAVDVYAGHARVVGHTEGAPKR